MPANRILLAHPLVLKTRRLISIELAQTPLCGIVELLIYALLVLAAGTPSGFKGWKRKYHSGYLAADEKLYLFFRCNQVSAKRIRRMAYPLDTPTFPPTPCTNDTMDDDSESSGEDRRRRRDARIRRQPFPMRPRYIPPRPC